MEDTRYLTTDFEIMSNFDLSPICAAFGEDAVVLYNGKWGRHYKASFETSNELSNDVNDIIYVVSSFLCRLCSNVLPSPLQVPVQCEMHL